MRRLTLGGDVDVIAVDVKSFRAVCRTRYTQPSSSAGGGGEDTRRLGGLNTAPSTCSSTTRGVSTKPMRNLSKSSLLECINGYENGNEDCQLEMRQNVLNFKL